MNSRSFTTTPAAIAIDHARDVASLVGQGIEAAYANTMPAAVRDIIGASTRPRLCMYPSCRCTLPPGTAPSCPKGRGQ